MIRIARPEDLPAIEGVGRSTEMFLGDELDHFTAMLAEHLEAPSEGTSLLVAEKEGEIVGASYAMNEAMAQGVANLLFIGVQSERRRIGAGRELLSSFENWARKRGERLAIIETASDDMFAPAWALYEQAGYVRCAVVPDYFTDGLDKLIFRKRL